MRYIPVNISGEINESIQEELRAFFLSWFVDGDHCQRFLDIFALAQQGNMDITRKYNSIALLHGDAGDAMEVMRTCFDDMVVTPKINAKIPKNTRIVCVDTIPDDPTLRAITEGRLFGGSRCSLFVRCDSKPISKPSVSADMKCRVMPIQAQRGVPANEGFYTDKYRWQMCLMLLNRNWYLNAFTPRDPPDTQEFDEFYSSTTASGADDILNEPTPPRHIGVRRILPHVS